MLVLLATFNAAVAAGANQPPPDLDAEAVAQADQILSGAAFRGGLIVHIGCGEARLTAALSAGEKSLVQGLSVDALQVERARRYVRGLGRYGTVSIDRFDGKRLPYAENLVNLVVSDDEQTVAEAEILRVLAPGGVACVRSAGVWQQTVKPRPAEIDDWTHFLYAADGNAVSRDRRVGPPRRLQWDGGPRWSRSHETDMSLTAAVTSGGLIFHTLDEGPIGIHETPRDRRQLPDRCSLVARDAFNGIVIWKREIPDWGSAAWDSRRWRWGKNDQLWSSPLTLPRRLVAAADRVYVTLGFDACVSELDAGTGRTLREFPQTLAAEEIVLSQNTLVVRVRGNAAASVEGHSIVAVDTRSGAVLWQKPVAAIADLTLAAANDHVCFHDTRQLVALDLATGALRWRAQPDQAGNSRRETDAGTLVIADDVLLFAQAARLEARRLADGQLLWNTKTNTSFRGMPDVFVIDGVVWCGTLTTQGLDLHTGQVMREIDPGHLYTGGHHARCYRGKATEDYLLWSKRGVEFLDLEADDHMRHDWVRGTCRYGIIPANGLLYAPPHPCFCYPGVKLSGFNALAAGAGGQDRSAAVPETGLEKGPAYDSLPAPTLAGRPAEDWPTYRHDNARSGYTGTAVPAQLQPGWSVHLAGRLSPPVVAGGRLFVSQIDAHRVSCLDAGSGESLWSYIAGGPVDSPPTVCDGRVVFGCTDGSVYCLRADDGGLIWRFRAAPQDRRIVSYGRLESAWPVHGSVLIQDATVYFAAGRSTYLDGGMYLYALDVATGQVRHQAHLAGPEPDLSVPCDRAHEMDGSKNDILVSNGRKLFLTQNVFDLQLRPLEAPQIAKWGARETDLHLVATGGFLDDSGFDRLYWMYARRWPGLYVAHETSKAGQILVFDDTTTYGLHTFNQKFSRSPYFAPGTEGYELFADGNDNEPILPEQAARRERGSMARVEPPKWSVQIPVRALGMVLAADTLFLAGPPDVIDADDPYGAFEGRQGGRLWAVSTADGSRIVEYQLDSPPVFDGLVAAHGKLYFTTSDGRVCCWQ
jgi:outer membrane protein assembly factor BamB